MGRDVQADISTAAKRARLTPRKNPYWTALSGGRGGVSLGYRRSTGPGAWIAKVVVDGNRSESRLGLADDQPFDGALAYRAAVEAALEWSRQQYATLEAGPSKAARQPVTVEMAVREYLIVRKRKSASSAKNATSRLTIHVLGDKAFAGTRLAKLRASTIEGWRDRLAVKTDDAESEGLAPASVNRLLNDLRAALNAAAERRRRELPAHIMSEIRIGTRRMQADSGATMMLLSVEQVRATVEAARAHELEFGHLVAALAATGARFSQLAAVRVADLQAAQNRLMIPSSRKGRASKARAPIAFPLGADVAAALAEAAAGRSAAEPLFRRWAYRRGTGLGWIKDRLEPLGAASEAQASWAAVVKAADLPAGTTMYALRHSSIVRGLTAGLPVRLVAALHDTSVPMIEKHYSAYIVDATEDLARRAALAL